MQILRIKNLTGALLGILILMVVIYFVSLYLNFILSAKIQENSIRIADLKEEILSQELKLRKAEADFFKSKDKLLGEMEKVNSIKYLTSDSVAASDFSILRP